MEELLYDAKTLAGIIINRDMSIRASQKFLNDIWEYEKEYLFETGTPFLCAKIFVIDDVTHSTMLFNYEY